ncbi:MAG TPA: cation-transporting P-type ATPase [Methanomassiliicoccales archaeon]|jgi:Ca2+-transporting ATPase
MVSWHSVDEEAVLKDLLTDKEKGISSEEAKKRLREYGPNRFFQVKKISFFVILREEIVEPMILLLLFIGVLYSILGSLADAATIIVIIIILVITEVYNEYRAKKSILSLKELSSPVAEVVRDGRPMVAKTEDLVPGDIMLLRTGERVPADARLLVSLGIEADESSLTGESFPVQKSPGKLEGSTDLADRNNMVFSGTVVTRGEGRAVIVATGVQAEIGKIGKIVEEIRDPRTPLQLEMKALAKFLVWVALTFSILVPVLGIIRGSIPINDYSQMILTGLSLAFATIPEELPIVITMVLAVGALALSRKHAMVKKLRAAETLGSVTVIATDKTGTITQNKMRLESFYLDGKVISSKDLTSADPQIIDAALLASGVIRDGAVGNSYRNPMAQALTEVDPSKRVEELSNRWNLVDEVTFDNLRKMATYIYDIQGRERMFSSGASEVLLGRSSYAMELGREVPLTDGLRKEITEKAEEMARSGQRVIAFAYRDLKDKRDRDETGLVFAAMAGFFDPPREEARSSIQSCRDAGIRVLMVTGDHPRTAQAVAAQVGIDSESVLTGSDIDGMDDNDLKEALARTSVFARTSPEHKARIVRLLKDRGEIVAVTGDGINDAPALKEAHIGIAMGTRSTDIAKESADMVLTDDNFATIQTAVGEGRKMFDNLSKGVRYYLACKAALVAAFLLPIGLGVPLPFSPVQIIMLELFMDLGASAAFVAERAEGDVMKRKPRDPKHEFMDRKMVGSIAVGAISLFAAVSAAYLYTWYTDGNLAVSQTVAFSTWLLGHIFLAFNMRSTSEPLAHMGYTSNRVMLLWAMAALVMLLIAVPLPFLHETLRLQSISAAQWGLVIVAAFIATFWMEARKLIVSRKGTIS